MSKDLFEKFPPLFWVIILFLASLVIWDIRKDPKPEEQKPGSVRVDTVYIDRVRTVYVQKEGKIVYEKVVVDSLIYVPQFPVFTARIDTLLSDSTYSQKLSVSYRYPSNIFELSQDIVVKDRIILVEKNIEVTDRFRPFMTGSGTISKDGYGVKLGGGMMIRERFFFGASADTNKSLCIDLMYGF